MNHFMLGHLMEWQYAYVAGIRQQPGDIGWHRVLIAPNPGSLESASATFHAPTGTFAVAWRRSGKKFEMTVTSPRGVSTVAVLPNGERRQIAPGKVTLRAELH